MSEPWIDPIPSVLLVLGLGGAVLGLAGLLCRSPQGWLPPRMVLAGVPLVAGFCAAAAVQGQPAAVWLPPALLAGACGLYCLARSERLAHGAAAFGRLARSSRWQSVCLLLASPLLAGAWALRLNQAGDSPPPDVTEIPNAERDFVEVRPTPVCTDRGRPVRVCRLAYRNADPEKLARLQKVMLRRLGLEARVIALPNTDDYCNCTGWIFTGGTYWLKDKDPTPILEDNGYRPVKEPRAGDLIIYYDASDVAVHYGVVRVAHPDMPVLVESKWGDYGVYLHPVTAHPYPGTRPCFYRSPRPSHLLRAVQPASNSQAASGSSRR